MATYKVLKPTSKSIINNVIPKKEYTETYYEHLSKIGRRFSHSGFESTSGGTSESLIFNIDVDDVCFITNVTMQGTYGDQLPIAINEIVSLKVAKTQEVLGFLFMDNQNVTPTSLVFSKSYPIPYKIYGYDTVNINCGVDVGALYVIEGFFVKKDQII